MCEEIKLIQTHLGIWNVREWDWNIIIRQFNNLKGLYLIRCKPNGKILIGEGALGSCGPTNSRIGAHFRNETKNKSFQDDLKLYGKEQFELYGFIIENDEQIRKNIEYSLHKYFKNTCYNRARPPIWMIEKLYEEGKTKKQISEILDCAASTIGRYIRDGLTSKYKGVYFKKKAGAYCSRHGSGITCVELGYYDNEIHAGQNRDYFIVKNNLMHKENLNFHDINYYNFKPHKTRTGKVNKHLL